MRIFKMVAVGMICVAAGRLSAGLESKVSSLKSAGIAVFKGVESKVGVLRPPVAAQQGSVPKTVTGEANAGLIDRNVDAYSYYSYEKHSNVWVTK